MNTVFAIALVIGVLALGTWIVFAAVASGVAGWDRYDPEAAIGPWGRRVIAALVGFGMAGLSSSYAGWPTAAVVVGSVAGAVGLALATEWLAPPSP